jgi:hypothetical protein
MDHLSKLKSELKEIRDKFSKEPSPSPIVFPETIIMNENPFRILIKADDCKY